MNRGILPRDYYAISEQFSAGLQPDVLTLQRPAREEDDRSSETSAALTIAPPKVQVMAESEREFYRRKQSLVAVRVAAGDEVEAIIEVVSPGNKSSGRALRSFLDKASDMLDRHVHLLVLDLVPRGLAILAGFTRRSGRSTRGSALPPRAARR